MARLWLSLNEQRCFLKNKGKTVMNTWLDLEKRFRDIVPMLSNARLDRQWGDAGEFWNLSGGFQSNFLEQYRMLALIAGQLLEKSLPKSDPLSVKILKETSFDGRWYRAIWELTNKKENYISGVMQDEKGEDAGHIYSAMIFDVVEVSANLCLRLHALYPIKDDKTDIPNINISGDFIGVLNAGEMEEIRSISVNISSLREAGNGELAAAIENLTKAVELSNEVDDLSKQEIIEQLSLLSTQAVEPPEKRLKPSIIKSITSSLATSLSVASDLSQIWSVWGPIIITFFK